MTQKTERAEALLKLVPRVWEAPDPLEEGTLLEQGLLCILTRHLSRKQAVATIKSLQQGFPDWNELRVAQVQEIVPHVSARAKNGASLIVARAIKDYLQEVFQQNHGFDLEFLREDLPNAVKYLVDFSFLGAAASHYIVWFAGERSLPVSPGLVRTLDRLGLVGRTSSMKKARVAIEPLVPKDRVLDFAVGFGTVVERWCEAKKPTCWECPLVDECPYGKKAFKDWKAQQERIAAQRKREEVRADALRKKEEARQKREDERRRKDAEKRGKKLEREHERRRRVAEKKRVLEERKKDLARKQQETDKKRTALAKKKTAGKKKPASKKKPAKKPAKKATKKKSTAKPAKKKPVAKKASKKKPAAKKPAAKKPAAKKPAAKKPAAKKPAARKKVTKKTTGKTSGRKKR